MLLGRLQAETDHSTPTPPNEYLAGVIFSFCKVHNKNHLNLQFIRLKQSIPPEEVVGTAGSFNKKIATHVDNFFFGHPGLVAFLKTCGFCPKYLLLC